MSVNPVVLSRRTLLHRFCVVLQGVMASALFAPLRVLAQAIPQAALDKLLALMPGRVIDRTAANYELTRLTSVWQQVKPTKSPALIVQVKSVAEVIKTVNFARDNHLRIAIRNGGHSYYGSFLQDDMILLDLSALRELQIDSDRALAHVQPAMRSVDFMSEIARAGFSFPAAHCGAVPLGGFLLGGGLGWNGEAWGDMSCFNIREVEVVTAEGKLITANAEQNTDYYWAARGAGPNFFGVVTRFSLDLYRNPAVILTSTLTWEISEAKVVADWLETHLGSMPNYVEALLILTHNPEAKHRAGEERVCIVQVSAFADTEDLARSALAPLAGADQPARCLGKTEFAPTPIADLYQWDATAYPQWRWDVDALWSDDPAAELVDKLVEHIRAMPSAKSSVLLSLKPNTKPLPDAAFSMIGRVYLACYAIWATEQEDQANRDWVRKNLALLDANIKGHYINESNYAANPARAQHSFASSNFAKLKTLSSKHDPQRLFHNYLDVGEA